MAPSISLHISRAASGRRCPRRSSRPRATWRIPALDAPQAAGGDIRGRQSAAMIVVAAKSTGRPWADSIYNLRVDDSPEPLKELRRLTILQRAYNQMNAGD